MIDFEKLKNKVLDLLKNDNSGHDYLHTIRVFNNAVKIAKEEPGVDLEVVKAASLFHDIGYSEDDLQEEHGLVGARIAKSVLENEGFTDNQLDKIIQAIKLHNFWVHKGDDYFLELKILRDADRLDAIGYIGIMRAIAYATNSKKDVMQILKEQLTSTFETKKGKEIAEEKMEIIKGFIENLENEIKGNKRTNSTSSS